MSVDSARIEAAVSELIRAIGDDPSRPGLADTPRLVAQSYAEFFAGIDADAAAPLREAVALGSDDGSKPSDDDSGKPSSEHGSKPSIKHGGDLVLVRDLAFRSMCEHHLLPFTGVAHVAYLPGERVVGLGRIGQALELFAARPQLQERLGDELAGALDSELAPRGVIVVLSAHHGCVSARGSRQSASTTVTVASRGELADATVQAGVLALIGSDHAP